MSNQKRPNTRTTSSSSRTSGTASRKSNDLSRANQYERSSANAKKMKKKKRRKKKILIFAVELVILFVLLAGFYVMSKLNKIDYDAVDEDDLVINQLDSETAALLQGYTTIALFGVDNHTAGDYSNTRTDTIIIAAINNDSKEVKLCSVYRDTYLNLTDGSYNKANGAYAAGGPTQAISMLNNNLDLDIKNYVTVDFSAMINIIDILGGITLDISADEAAAMNGTSTHSQEDYITTLNETMKNGQYTPDSWTPASHVTAGDNQLCNGVQAVAYCRVRYTAGDDYKRAERQRLVISKIVEKVKASGIGTLNEIIDTVAPQISTGFSATQLLGLSVKLMDYDLGETAGFPFYKNTGTVGKKGNLVIPCDLDKNVSYLHSFLYADEDYEVSDTVEKISAKIISDTGYTFENANDNLYGSVSSEDTSSSSDTTSSGE